MSATRLLLAGPSGCGKSTLARELGAWFRVPVLCLDDYWRRGTVKFTEFEGQQIRTYEHPALYDGERMARDLRDLPSFVAEGFCLFHYQAIRDLNAAMFYLDLPHDVSRARRAARVPARPSDRSFMLIGRQESERWVLPQKQVAGVTMLDATLPTSDLFRTVCDSHSMPVGGK